jgi:hypothetical protein
VTRKFAAAAGAAAAFALCAPSAHAAICDPIGAGHCLLPFPNDYFAKKDARTPTGKRLALPRSAMPANKDGVRIEPRDWNRADGFSPGQQITVRTPGSTTGARSSAAGSCRSPTSSRASPSASRSC